MLVAHPSFRALPRFLRSYGNPQLCDCYNDNWITSYVIQLCYHSWVVDDYEGVVYCAGRHAVGSALTICPFVVPPGTPYEL